MKARLRQGKNKIWDLKYKNSEDLEIKLKKATKTIHNEWAKTDKGKERMRIF